MLLTSGVVTGAARDFTVRIGPAAHAKHQLRAGMRIAGVAEPVLDPEREVADLYKASGLKVEASAPVDASSPPWRGVPPALDVYRARGHRRLDPRTFDAHCRPCQWGCRMAVTMIIDQWNPGRQRHRFETFCYGPKSCPVYRTGPTRKVPGRNGMSWEEEDWVDEEATGHRGVDD